MRKMHYNEGMNIKLARQLIASELEEDEDADEEMRDATEESEEINVDPPQDGKEFLHRLEWTCLTVSSGLKFWSLCEEMQCCVAPEKNAAEVQRFINNGLVLWCTLSVQMSLKWKADGHCLFVLHCRVNTSTISCSIRAGVFHQTHYLDFSDVILTNPAIKCTTKFPSKKVLACSS